MQVRKGMKINRWLNFVAGSLFLLLVTGCFVIENQFTGLPPGPWRAVLKLEPVPVTPNPRGEPLPEKVDLKFEEVTEGQLPFNFEIVYDTKDSFHIEIINGEQRIRVDDITIGLDRQTAKDTVTIEFPVFDSYIRGIFEENVLEGEWVVRNRENYAIPFVAYHGQDYRFTTLRKDPVMDVSGKWEVTFGIDTDDPYPAVGEFEQDGNHLTGTFLTETGDYRYLEGTIQANKIYLSTFDGSHAYLFEAKIEEDSIMIGSFRSGKHYKTLWEASRNSAAELRNPEDLTSLREKDDRLSFSFPNADGEQVSLEDDRYQGKVKIIELMGTWCPNCYDASQFLSGYLKENPSDNLAVIAVAFERYRDREKAFEAIRTYKKRLSVDYEVLLGGYYEKADAQLAFPMLDRVVAYPTWIFVDRNNRIRKIITGINGPATSKYEEYKADFHQTVLELLDGVPSPS